MISAYLFLACTAGTELALVDSGSPLATARLADPTTANVLVIVADDLGVDAMACYPGYEATRASQPTLESLCRRGVVFDQAWSNPMSSPTRASLLTGRDAWRHGVGESVSYDRDNGLDASEVLLPSVLEAHRSGAFGKWHLASTDNGGDDHPLEAGFDRYVGSIEGQVEDYYDWTRVVDGERVETEAYATSVNVDDALRWIDAQRDPWFALVAFNAPHSPLHLPPDDLHSVEGLSGTAGDIRSNKLGYFLASVEAMDAEIGRLLDGIGRDKLDDTWIIFVGDNGTWSEVNQGVFPADHAKNSLYQGGVHVPLVVVGPMVDSPGRRVEHIVSTTDIFATVMELTGNDMGALVEEGLELDSVSFAPYLMATDAVSLRETMVAAQFGANTPAAQAGQAATDGSYKLIGFVDGTEELYDLRFDPFEEDDLLAGPLSDVEEAAWVQLSDVLEERPLISARSH